VGNINDKLLGKKLISYQRLAPHELSTTRFAPFLMLIFENGLSLIIHAHDGGQGTVSLHDINGKPIDADSFGEADV